MVSKNELTNYIINVKSIVTIQPNNQAAPASILQVTSSFVTCKRKNATSDL